MMMRENKYNSGFNQLDPSKLDAKLLFLQEYYTEKISRTSDENLIRFYLKQTGIIAQQRLSLRKAEHYENY